MNIKSIKFFECELCGWDVFYSYLNGKKQLAIIS